MFNPEKLLGNLLNCGFSSSKTSRLNRAISLPGGKAGLMALLGGVAVGAFEHYSQQRQRNQAIGSSRAGDSPLPLPPPPAATSSVPPPPPPRGTVSGPSSVKTGAPSTHSPSSQPTPVQTQETHRKAMILIRAMIAAAKADGIIDPKERKRILEHLADANDEERTFVESEMEKPLNMDEWLADVHGSEMTRELYTVSLLTIELDTTAEVKYLKSLAQRLGLDEAQVNHIHDQLGVIRIYA
jgi:uncharacterized membrane protein YebE (DUF533 family)